MLEVRSRAIFRNVSHVAGGSVMDDAVRRSRGSLCVPLCILATSVRPMKKAPIARARNGGTRSDRRIYGCRAGVKSPRSRALDSAAMSRYRVA